MLQIYHNSNRSTSANIDWETKLKTNQRSLISYNKSDGSYYTNIYLNSIFKKQIKKGLVIVIGGHYFARNQLVKSNLIYGIELNQNSNGIRLQTNIGKNENKYSYIAKGWYWLTNRFKVTFQKDFTSRNKLWQLSTSYVNYTHHFKLKNWISMKNLFSFGLRIVFDSKLNQNNLYSNNSNSSQFLHTKTERSMTLISNSNLIWNNHNEILYQTNNKQYLFGYFKSIDGIGINIGYHYNDFSIKIPLLFLCQTNTTDKGMISQLLFLVADICIFQFFYWCTSNLTKILNGSLFMKQKDYSSRDINELTQSINNSKLIQQLLKGHAEKITSFQSKKDHNGLVIEYALYGNKSILERIMRENTLTKAYINEILTDMNNEVIDVTNSCIYLIDNNTSSVCFDKLPSIIGFINPLLSNQKKPYFLIKYEYNHISYMKLYESKNSFIIP